MNLLAKAKEFIGGAADKAGGNIIGAIGGVIDNLTISKEEKAQINQKITEEVNRNMEAMKALDTEEAKAFLADTDSARDMNTKIQESSSASKLSKNVAYILDIIFVAVFFVMMASILFKKVPAENKEIFYMGFGLLGGYVGQIVAFHRGTSQGSKDKGQKMESMMNK